MSILDGGCNRYSGTWFLVKEYTSDGPEIGSINVESRTETVGWSRIDQTLRKDNDNVALSEIRLAA